MLSSFSYNSIFNILLDRNLASYFFETKTSGIFIVYSVALRTSTSRGSLASYINYLNNYLPGLYIFRSLRDRRSSISGLD